MDTVKDLVNKVCNQTTLMGGSANVVQDSF